MSTHHIVTLSDFLLLCGVDDREGWCPWLDVRDDGVYVKGVTTWDGGGLTRNELSVLLEHPLRGDLALPALRLPCTLPELLAFVDAYGVAGCIDESEMGDWLSERKPSPSSHGKLPHSAINANSGCVRPVGAQRYQEQRIIEILQMLGKNPLALAKHKPGKPGIKSEVRQIIGNEMSAKVFKKAWERLRGFGDIKNSE